ncbi:MAG: Hsp20/alpha crystallin family protein [Anaerolineales bacterium]|nr:Hsp20/alpha crystallin family protein [Anaerolineales bacterium]MCS7246882.1 Hsp20/alpha crystallin family protein [Anaerolineales bacterium]MDW8160693.1 Hsp20/alpha crystallin family protein [Anaerolineales bacterium]MDW8448165.1 Hsp20/alpha crystallin family protein [Anaerolineales bacterium]
MFELHLKSSLSRPGVYILESFRRLEDTYPHGFLIARPHLWRPSTDVFETEDALIVRIEVAGMREEDFTILLDSKYLTVRGVRVDTSERRAYHQMEIPFGEFISEVELPFAVDAERIEAVYQAGFLRITLPKKPPQHIPIRK